MSSVPVIVSWADVQNHVLSGHTEEVGMLLERRNETDIRVECEMYGRSWNRPRKIVREAK